MLVGAHVRGGGPLADAVERGRELGADAIQVFTQSPRMWRPSRHTPGAVAAFRSALAGQEQVRAVFCHATYLVNLATADADLLERSVQCLVDNLRVATAMGAQGLVLHVGSHRGGGFDGCLDQVAAVLGHVLGAVPPPADEPACPILLENAAGAGGTVGRDVEELAAILERVADPHAPARGAGRSGAGARAGAGTRGGGAGGTPAQQRGRLGVCLDTQHLWASGVDFTTLGTADRLVADVDAAVGLERLRCIHLNDSAVPFGANRDRHANLGAGTIGADGLAALLGHPDLQDVPAVLEVPGDGSGPTAEEVARGKALVADGLARRTAGQVTSSGGAAGGPAGRARSSGGASGGPAGRARPSGG